ncbi:MAG: hypothetical protein HQK58_03530 [Deltaproteobacteria bacterium]|nr:hypothetical protein [Deltaproteobacteria bacterium]
MSKTKFYHILVFVFLIGAFLSGYLILRVLSDVYYRSLPPDYFDLAGLLVAGILFLVCSCGILMTIRIIKIVWERRESLPVIVTAGPAPVDRPSQDGLSQALPPQESKGRKLDQKIRADQSSEDDLQTVAVSEADKARHNMMALTALSEIEELKKATCEVRAAEVRERRLRETAEVQRLELEKQIMLKDFSFEDHLDAALAKVDQLGKLPSTSRILAKTLKLYSCIKQKTNNE